MKNTVSHRLLNWFASHGRKELPWQIDPSPYRVWISEIMLQQTQVATVIPYYQRFMQRFPDVQSLAVAQLDEVLHLWTGLGYYARARNLHRTAIIMREQYHGQFPLDIEALKQLPGIGRSTAGAILALAAGQRHAILDGNVKRVLARMHAIDGWPANTQVQAKLWTLAETHTPSTDVDRYTQAIMDLGATVCTRSRPVCQLCPLADVCIAHAQGRETDYPAPKPRIARPLRNTLLLMLRNPRGDVLLEQRPPAGIWGGLWSFPECTPAQSAQDLRQWCEERLGYSIRDIDYWPVVRHGFSHFDLDIMPVSARVSTAQLAQAMEPRSTVWYNNAIPDARGLAAPVKRLLNRLFDRIKEKV
jgi:A/G-specific adenine glycosylase